MTSALAGTRGVVGYEMLNEPWPARPAAADPALGAGALSDNATLSPLYDSLHAAVRAQDPDGLFFFEPLVCRALRQLVVVAAAAAAAVVVVVVVVVVVLPKGLTKP